MTVGTVMKKCLKCNRIWWNVLGKNQQQGEEASCIECGSLNITEDW